ncbi:MAG: arginine--tRNA ligase [Pseudomonadota bacterium]
MTTVNLRAALETALETALATAGASASSAAVRQAAKPEFGDYQANGVMGAAKRFKQNPRELAAAVVEAAELDAVADLEIAGPGFINVRLKPEWLAATLNATRAPLTPTPPPRTVVVDYSAPNLAKEMHVGHIRSTIIGDALARAFEALGHRVIRQNHVGDWGTQFGMLVAHLADADGAETGGDDGLADLETFYRAAKVRFDGDPAFAERARRTVVGLQGGDPEIRAAWQRFIELSLAHCQSLYERLGTTLTPQDVMAESAYNDDLAGIIDALKAKNLLQESDGAQCVFLDQFKAKDGSVQPVIVQKSDGGYLYATTDLAAVRHRSERLAADRVLYFVDARQSLHFQQIFAVAAAAELSRPVVSFEHMPFGAMLGKDGRPFKTRAGGVVKLADLLDEAEERAAAQLAERDTITDPAERAHAARVIGIGAVKYADLSKNRTSDYIFDWDAMLALEGNTAPYLMYAVARVHSLLRRAEVDFDAALAFPIEAPEAGAEHQLAVALLRLQEVVVQLLEDGLPHHLCSFLYELANRYMKFYEACPILKSAEPLRSSRLALSARTAQTLTKGLDLLGIQTLDRM